MSLEESREQLEKALQQAAERRATDAFLFAGEPLALRIGGKVERTDGPVYSSEELRKMAMAAVGEARLSHTLVKTGAATTTMLLPGGVAGQLIVGTAGGEFALSLRVLPAHLPDVKAIAVPEAVLEAAKSPSGLLMFSGPVGSGKTTTMYSVLDHINRTEAKLLCTVEDPITYHLTPKRPLVLQKEVGTDVPDIASGIGVAVMQDADVILVGELKTPEDVRAAVLTASNVGRLVLTQTHARTAARSIVRLIESQPLEARAAFRRMLSEGLRAATAQVLLPTVDGSRAAAYDVLVPDDAFRKALAAGENPFLRTFPAAHGKNIVEDVKRLAKEGRIASQTAELAIAELTPLMDVGSWPE